MVNQRQPQIYVRSLLEEPKREAKTIFERANDFFFLNNLFSFNGFVLLPL